MLPFTYYGAHKKEILLHTKDVKNIVYLFYFPIIELKWYIPLSFDGVGLTTSRYNVYGPFGLPK